MARSRFRALFLLAAFLLVAPMAAVTGSRVIAQDATPVAIEDATSAPLADIMPPGVPLYIATEFDVGGDQYVKTAGLTAEMLIPGAGGIVSGIAETLVSLLARLPSDTRTILEGEAGIALTSLWQADLMESLGADEAGASAISQGIGASAVVILHPHEAAKARSLIEDWYTAELEATGQSVDRETIGDSVILSSPAPEALADGAPRVVAFAGDYVLLGQRYDDLIPFIATIDGDIPGLGELSAFQDLQALLPSERLLFGYLNGAALQGILTAIDPESGLLAAIDAPFGQTLFTVAADDAGFRFESVSESLDSSIDPDTTIEDNPDFAAGVPSTTQAMLAGTDLGESWAIDQLQTLLLSFLASSLGGGEVDLSDIDADAQFGFLSMITGVNFKTDLLDQLTGDYGVALFDVNPQDVLSSSAVISSELADPDRVSVAVTSLGPLLQSVGSGTASVTTASVDGQTVNNITLSTGIFSGTLQYGVVDDQLMIGVGDGIETLATPAFESLADTPAYQAAMSELPDAYDGVLYVDLASIGAAFAPQIFEMIGSSVDNPIAACLAGAAAQPEATPQALSESDSTDWIASTACSIFAGLLGGGEGIQNLLINRIPGPLAAVGYHQDNVQHVSGILMIGSS